MAERSTLRRRATVYIVADEQVLMIARYRHGRCYYVVPGGGVEPDESWAEAAVREAWEETSLQVELGPVLHELAWQMDDISQTERAYLVTSFRGQPQLNDPEILAHSTAENRYALEWVPLHQLPTLPCYPPLVDVAVLQQALTG